MAAPPGQEISSERVPSRELTLHDRDFRAPNTSPAAPVKRHAIEVKPERIQQTLAASGLGPPALSFPLPVSSPLFDDKGLIYGIQKPGMGSAEQLIQHDPDFLRNPGAGFAPNLVPQLWGITTSGSLAGAAGLTGTAGLTQGGTSLTQAGQFPKVEGGLPRIRGWDGSLPGSLFFTPTGLHPAAIPMTSSTTPRKRSAILTKRPSFYCRDCKIHFLATVLKKSNAGAVQHRCSFAGRPITRKVGIKSKICTGTHQGACIIRSDQLTPAEKESEASANDDTAHSVCEDVDGLRYIKRYAPLGPLSRIRVWRSKNNVECAFSTFYDCQCNELFPPVSNFQIAKRHACMHDKTKNCCDVCSKWFTHHLQVNAHKKVHKTNLNKIRKRDGTFAGIVPPDGDLPIKKPRTSKTPKVEKPFQAVNGWDPTSRLFNGLDQPFYPQLAFLNAAGATAWTTGPGLQASITVPPPVEPRIFGQGSATASDSIFDPLTSAFQKPPNGLLFPTSMT